LGCGARAVKNPDTFLVRENTGKLIENVMNLLAQRRPIFHSEGDFQFEFAFEMKTLCQKQGVPIEVRCEHPYQIGKIEGKNGEHIDAVFTDKAGFKLAVEFKYVPSNLSYTTQKEGEQFELRTGTPDFSRYYFISDIQKLERRATFMELGCAIIISNHHTLWEKKYRGMRKNSKFTEFMLSEERCLNGKMEWKGGKTPKGYKPLNLSGNYPLLWRDYSNLEVVNGVFRYLMVEV